MRETQLLDFWWSCLGRFLQCTSSPQTFIGLLCLGGWRSRQQKRGSLGQVSQRCLCAHAQVSRGYSRFYTYIFFVSFCSWREGWGDHGLDCHPMCYCRQWGWSSVPIGGEGVLTPSHKHTGANNVINGYKIHPLHICLLDNYSIHLINFGALVCHQFQMS